MVSANSNAVHGRPIQLPEGAASLHPALAAGWFETAVAKGRGEAGGEALNRLRHPPPPPSSSLVSSSSAHSRGSLWLQHVHPLGSLPDAILPVQLPARGRSRWRGEEYAAAPFIERGLTFWWLRVQPWFVIVACVGAHSPPEPHASARLPHTWMQTQLLLLASRRAGDKGK